MVVLASRIQQALLVALVAALVMLTNLGGPRLWDRDEPRNAGCAREMLERGDWVVPTFNAKLRPHKPVLLYWGIMSAYSMLGVSEFSARLPSALCAIGSTLCTWFIGRRLFSPAAGVWAAIALASSLMFGVAGRAATPDSVLIFCTTLAPAIYVYGTFRARFDGAPADTPSQLVAPGHYFPQHWPTALAMYAVLGLAVLAKGPVGFVLPTAVIGMFLLIVRLPAEATPQPLTLGRVLFALLRPFEPLHFLRTCWIMRPFTAIFAALAVALPWYWAVGLATDGEFLRGFFIDHNLHRATGAMEGHGGSVFFYPVAIVLGFFPWSIFMVPLVLDAGMQLRRREGRNVGYLLAACWVGVYLALFTIARTKLPSYVTPCYPGLALLAGAYADRWTRDAASISRWWPAVSFGSLAVVGAAFAVAVPMIAEKYLPGEEWLGLLGLTPLAAGVACIGLAIARNYRAAAATFAATGALFSTMLFAVGAQRADHHQTSHVVLRAMIDHSRDPQIASYKILEPSWVFYAGRPIQEIVERSHEEHRRTSDLVVEHFLGHPEAFLITTDTRLQELAGQLPPDVGIVAETPLFLQKERLVLLGRMEREPGPVAQGVHSPQEVTPWK
jgi:4-amino-4-deoxy-L-arabinose transferase-like glycosyltransferase